MQKLPVCNWVSKGDLLSPPKATSLLSFGKGAVDQNWHDIHTILPAYSSHLRAEDNLAMGISKPGASQFIILLGVIGKDSDAGRDWGQEEKGENRA